MTESRNEMPRGKHARVVSQDEGAYDAGQAEDAQGARQGGYAQDAYQGKHAHGISQSENMQDGRQGKYACEANRAVDAQGKHAHDAIQPESAQTERAQACQSKRAQGPGKRAQSARQAKYARGKHAQPVEKQSFTASLNQVVDSRAATPQQRKTLWAAAFLVAIAALLLGVGLTYSAFSGNDHLKAVPVTGESQSLFASDTLAPYKTTPSEEAMAGRNVVVDTSGSECSFTFKIYNCLLDDPNVFNDREVTYTLSVVAKSATGQKSPVSSGWRIKLGEDGAEKKPDADGMVTFDATELPGTKGVINKYKITLDTGLVDTTTFVVRATVDDKISPGTTLNCLAAKVSPVQRADVESASVTGGWADSGDIDVTNYAAYNYRVTVTGKSQNVTLTWGDNLELDPFFETNHPGCAINGNTVTYTAEAGSEIVNFYRAAGSAAPKEWSDITVSVSGSN